MNFIRWYAFHPSMLCVIILRLKPHSGESDSIFFRFNTSIRLSWEILRVEMTVDPNLLCHVDETEFSVWRG